jgi:multidrug efflux pump subunit AcrA (membrane-fusion protein)
MAKSDLPKLSSARSESPSATGDPANAAPMQPQRPLRAHRLVGAGHRRLAVPVVGGICPAGRRRASAGTVAIDTKRKAVQHLSGGIVKEVLVREGDEVQRGSC